MAAFVLVHGSWHGGWCWRKVVPLLRGKGHLVYAPSLTGLGDRSHLLTRGVNLYTHIRDIVRLIEFEDLRNVVLSGHSYGGMVITGAAEFVSGRVARLVYLDALVPRDGDCGFDLLPGARAARAAAAGASVRDWLAPPPAPGAFGVTDPEDVAWMAERLCPMPLAAHRQRVELRSREAERIPRSYILCRGGGIFSRSAGMACEAAAAEARRKGWDYREVEAAHDSMITAPREVTRVLLEIASESG